VTEAGVRRLEAYLAELYRCLGPLPEGDRNDVVTELRGHVLESVGEAPTEDAVAAVLQRLGPAGVLAEQYVVDGALATAERSGAPWTLVRTLAQAAGASLRGFLALLGCVFGYALALSLALAAVRKPMAPDRVGLWKLGTDTYSLRLGFGEAPGGQEILGWWIVPIGLLAGASLLWLTTSFGRWAIRRLRRSWARPAR
jgi:hypothetical protein